MAKQQRRDPRARASSQGNATGNYEKMTGHKPDGTSTAARSTGINAGGARADRPADAEPVAGVVVELGFSVVGAARVEHAAVPTLRFALRRRRRDGARALGPARRADPDRRAPARLRRGARTTGCSSSSGRSRTGARRCGRCCGRARRSSCPAFEGATVVDLDVPCSYDLEVAASRYLDALTDGEVPLEFLFSGSVFYAGERRRAADDAAVVGERGRVRLPVRVWKETMERYFRGTAWVRLSKESFDRLSAYKSRNALATWDDALEALGPMSDLRTLADAVHVRGLHALAVPAERAEEPAPLDVRLRVPAGVDARCIPTTRALMRTQVLLASDPHDVDVTVRFLQVEGVERAVGPRPVRVRRAARASSTSRSTAPRLTVTIRNTTPWAGEDREEALRHAFCSTHTLLARRALRLRHRGVRVRARRHCGRCWSATTRCSARRSSSRTIRGSRRSRPATCSTAARSTGCWR